MTAPLRIAVVTGKFPVASETFVIDHITGLLDRGHRVDIFGMPPDPGTPRHADLDRYALERRLHYWDPVPMGMGPRLGAVARVLWRTRTRAPGAIRAHLHARADLESAWRHLLRAGRLHGVSRRFDLVHAHFGRYAEEMAWLRHCGALPGPLWVSFHGADVNRPLRAGSRPYPFVFRDAERVLVTTRFMQGQSLALGCPAGKIVQSHIGIRLTQFPFAERRRAPGEPLRLLSVGRLVVRKGIDVAIRAVARLASAGHAVDYTIVGDGPEREALGALAAGLGQAARIHFCGALDRDRVIARLAAAHAFVFPSRTAPDGDQEAQGLVLQEAQACGLPVVASRHGGIPEGMSDGVSGYLFTEDDDASLAGRLEALIAAEPEWPRMGRAGRAFVAEHFDHDRQLDRVVELYRESLAAR